MKKRYRRLVWATVWGLSVTVANCASAAIVVPGKFETVGAPVPATVVAYAGTPLEGGSFDGPVGGNSPFAGALLRYLELPLDVGWILRRVHDAVLRSTSGNQKPVTHVSLPGHSVYLAVDPTSLPSEGQVTQDVQKAEGPLLVALTIGNAAYERRPLNTPIKDAADVASALQRLGFEVMQLTDLGQAAMADALHEFSNKASNANVAVVYYSGHGRLQADDEWLVPVDVQFVHDIHNEAISLASLMQAVEPAVLRVILLDADFGFPSSLR